MSDTHSLNVAAQNDSNDVVLDGLYFYLMSVLAKTNGYPIAIFIIIDHDNDNTVKGGSERLVETNEEVMTEGRNTLVIKQIAEINLPMLHRLF